MARKLKDAHEPAFPSGSIYDQECHCTLANWEGGITIRDYFAAKAMASIVLHGEYVEAMSSDRKRINKIWAGLVAHDAYALADAMLEARKQ